MPAFACALVAACSGSIGQPAWRVAAPTTVAAASVFVPAGAAAQRYNDAAPGPASSPLGERLIATVEAVCHRGGKGAPALDGRLSAVAADLARLPGDGPPPRDVVDFSLAYHGIIEPSPHVIWFAVGAGEDQGVAAELEARLPALLAQTSFARLGVGIAPAGGGSQTVVLALQESSVELDAIARELPRDGSLRLRGRVLAPYTRPRLYVTRQDGTVDSPPLVHEGASGFRADVRCGAAVGTMKIEIIAEDRPDNPANLANFPVSCGEAAPRTLALAAGARPGDDGGSDEADAAGAERTIFALVNRDRARAGLPGLAWDERAAAIARKHAIDMRDGQYVAHVSPRTGTLADRARAGGLATPLLLENLARSFSASEAEEGLMASPGHRENLLNAQATHLGVGAATGNEVAGHHELYVTQLFFRRPPLADRQLARADTLAAFAAARRSARVTPLVPDDALDGIAERHAEALAAGTPRDVADAESSAALDQLGDRFVKVMKVIEVIGDPTERIPPNIVDRAARVFGLGLAQGTHPELGEGAYFVVVLLAEPR